MHAIICMKYYRSDLSEKMLQFSMNDISAFAYAVRLKKTLLNKISILCMGPTNVIEPLKDCISFGADNIYLVSDPLYTGSDTLITSYILSEALKYINKSDTYHLVFCGENTDDSGTGQVGPGLACQMNYTFMPDVRKIDFAKEGFIISNQDYYIHSIEPVVISICDSISLPFPSLTNIVKAKTFEITKITNQELGLDIARVGHIASPTKVIKTVNARENKAKGINIFNGSPEEEATELIKMIKCKEV